MKTPEQKFNGTPGPERQGETPVSESERSVESLEGQRPTLEQIKQTLFDPYVISKKRDQEGRNVTALEVTRIREESLSLRADIGGRGSILSQIEQQASALNALKVEKLFALEKRTESILVRLKNIFNVKDKAVGELETEIDSLTTEMEILSTQTEEVKMELAMLKQQQKNIPNPQKLLEAYYEKMETIPLSNAEKRELLKPEVLAELSTEEYIALWRRLNPHFLSHVTRQGFRDHNAMIYHSAGLQEFHDGLVSVLEDEKILRPPIAVREGLRSRDGATVKRFLDGWVLQAENEEEAKKRLNIQLNNTLATAPKYPDSTAVHFAAQIVADGYYGGERNNEAFFVYPSDILASQHHFAFNGWEKDFTQPQSETKWNDVFIWPSSVDNPGILVDAGMVFLPENTLVDSETGSKYASEIKTMEGEEKRVMVEDEKLVSAFVEWAKNLNDESPIILAYKEFNKKYERWSSQQDRDDRERVCFDVFRTEIMSLGFTEEAALDITHDLFSSADGINQFQYNGALGFGDSKGEVALRRLRSASANWKRAENTITAKEYWERYFVEHSEQKPKHLIFYDGDPTSAIHEFQQKNNIGRADVSVEEGKLLGFDDRHVLNMNEDSRANVGYNELVATAHRIIAAHYQGTSG